MGPSLEPPAGPLAHAHRGRTCRESLGTGRGLLHFTTKPTIPPAHAIMHCACVHVHVVLVHVHVAVVRAWQRGGVPLADWLVLKVNHALTYTKG